MATGLPLIALGEQEAESLADAIVNLSAYYDIGAFAGKGAAILALIGTAGLIYGPRVATVLNMRKQARQRPTMPSNPIDIGDAPPSGTFDFSGMAGAFGQSM